MTLVINRLVATYTTHSRRRRNDRDKWTPRKLIDCVESRVNNIRTYIYIYIYIIPFLLSVRQARLKNKDIAAL